MNKHDNVHRLRKRIFVRHWFIGVHCLNVNTSSYNVNKLSSAMSLTTTATIDVTNCLGEIKMIKVRKSTMNEAM